MTRLPHLPAGADLSAVLSDILLYHVVDGAVDSGAVATLIGNGGTAMTKTSADDKELSIALVGDAVVLDGLTQVTTVDVPAANGIIHVVDSILLPSDIAFPGNHVEAASAYPMLSSLVDAVTNADAAVAGALTGDGPLTVFAPYNPAFDGVDTSMDLTGVLLYHAVPLEADSTAVVGLIGNDVTTAAGSTFAVEAGPTIRDGQNGVANVARVDLRTSNGIIHVIDSILMPPSDG